MLILITYDVNTETSAGRKRLRQIAKTCTNYGQRVQNSVFECNLDPAEFAKVKSMLLKIMNADTDSIRFYSLGNNYRNNIEHYGAKASFDVTEPIII